MRNKLFILIIVLIIAMMPAMAFGLGNDISDKTISLSETSYIFNGTEIEPEVSIDGLVKDQDYTVTYSDNIDAGTATVTVTGIGAYTGTASASFEIEKATPSVKITTSSKSVNYADVKKASTYTTALSVSGAKGTKTFTKVSGSDRLTITKAGKIKVKKGTKPGTYKIKVKVKSEATENYSAKTSASRTVSVKVYYHVQTDNYRKYLGTWKDVDTSMKINVVNPYYISGVLIDNDTGEKISFKKDADMTGYNNYILETKNGDSVKFRMKLAYGKSYTDYSGNRVVDGPKFYVQSSDYRWNNIMYMNNKPVYMVFQKFI